MPEHPRLAGIDDCRDACRWLTGNGPGDHPDLPEGREAFEAIKKFPPSKS